MSRPTKLKLGQKWPDGGSDNKYWMCADPMASRTHHGDGLVVLGRECSSLAEIEEVAADVREDLERVLAEARRKLA